MAKPRGRGRIKKKKGGATAPRKRRPLLSAEELDWKNFPSLRRFLSERGKLRSRRITGLSRRQQALAAREIKRAREMGLLPFVMPKLERARGGGRPDRRGEDRDDQTMASVEAQEAGATEVLTAVADMQDEVAVETAADDS